LRSQGDNGITIERECS